MTHAIEKAGLLRQAATSIRIAIATMAVCCFFYPLFTLGVGRVWTPYSANGSLLRNNEGDIVGSELIAQKFSRIEYFWPRPSAVDYNAAAAGGSNLSPKNPELRTRAKDQAARFGATVSSPMPADLATASGSGLDPHITLAAARYQMQRVASARRLSVETVAELVVRNAKQQPGGKLTAQPLVNVLLLNMELDRLDK